MYDVVIGGGSFAGLAVAQRIKGKVLVIDRARIGKGQTSACVTFRPVVEEVGAEDAVIQEFTHALLHLDGVDPMPFEVEPPFCAFDYEKFCRLMLKRSGAEILTATVKGVEGDTVLTDKGDFAGKVVVDATGWRAALASSVDPSAKVDARRRNSFGFETVLPYSDDKLHFYYRPGRLGRGYAWVFPAGDVARFGIGSYAGKTKLKAQFSSFLADFGLEADSLHGGFFPHRLRKPVVGNLFVVGDAAGMCFPGSGEGIRTAVYFGRRCGEIIQEVLDGKLAPADGLETYRELVYEKARYYFFLFDIQRMLTLVPASLARPIARYIHGHFDRFLERYLNITEHGINIGSQNG